MEELENAEQRGKGGMGDNSPVKCCASADNRLICHRCQHHD